MEIIAHDNLFLSSHSPVGGEGTKDFELILFVSWCTGGVDGRDVDGGKRSKCGVDFLI
jgi:hypothetical protein